MPYSVYILRTSGNTLYIGQTNNLKKRIWEHQNKTSKSAKYVRYFSSFDLVYSETYKTRKEAMQREAQLKKWPKAKKEALVRDDKILLKDLMNTLIKKSTDTLSALNIAKKNAHYFNSSGLKTMEKDLKAATLIGAYSENKMVGFIAFKELNEQAVELAWIAIEPEYQNQGMGTFLVKEAIKLLPKKYVICETKTLAETDPDPQYARTRNFYKKSGFIPLEIISRHPGWGKSNPCQIFIKVLT